MAVPGRAVPGSCPRCRARGAVPAASWLLRMLEVISPPVHPAQPVRGWARPLQPFWGDLEDQAGTE